MSFRYVDPQVLADLAAQNQSRQQGIRTIADSVEGAMYQVGRDAEWTRARRDLEAICSDLQAESQSLDQRASVASDLLTDLNQTSAASVAAVDVPILSPGVRAWMERIAGGVPAAVSGAIAANTASFGRIGLERHLPGTFTRLLLDVRFVAKATPHTANAWLHANAHSVTRISSTAGHAMTALEIAGDINRNFTREDYQGNVRKQLKGSAFDAAVSGGTHLATGLAAAKAGAVAGTFIGGPIGTAVGFGAGLAIGIGISWAAHEFKHSPFRDHIVDGLAGEGWDAAKQDVVQAGEAVRGWGNGAMDMFKTGAGTAFDTLVSPWVGAASLGAAAARAGMGAA